MRYVYLLSGQLFNGKLHHGNCRKTCSVAAFKAVPLVVRPEIDNVQKKDAGAAQSVSLSQGKDVFAVPGPITSPCSRGTNKLIKECPSMVMATCAEDIWSRYADQPWRKPAPRKTRQPSSGGEAEKTDDTEEAILRLLSVPVQIDQIAAKAGLDISAGDLSAKLMMMEIKGLVKQLPGKYYQTVARRI